MNTKTFRNRMIVKVIALTMMVVLMTASCPMSTFAASSWPGLSGSAYCEFVAAKNINVYRNSGCSTRGTSSPAKSYNAYIDKNDICRMIAITSNYVQLQYPTSSGYKTGYVRRSDIFNVSAPSECVTSRGKATTYKTAGGSSYGYIAANDRVYACGTSGSYTAVIYQAKSGSRAYKFGFVTNNNYNNIVKKSSVPSNTVQQPKNSFDPIWPLAKSYTVTTLYYYSDGSRHSTRYKYGIDMAAPKGETVYAVEDGTVICSEYSTSSGFGNLIKIKHNNGKVSLYAHLNSRDVSYGKTVKKGQKIGTVGNTSAKYNIGYHLHFELGNSDAGGAAGDPWQEYFKPKYGNKVTLTQAAKKYPNPTK